MADARPFILASLGARVAYRWERVQGRLRLVRAVDVDAPQADPTDVRISVPGTVSPCSGWAAAQLARYAAQQEVAGA